MLNAQVTVTGTVTGQEDDVPIPGVNIVEKGTNNGTITTADGTYSITISPGAVLLYSFVGLVSQEVTVGNQTIIDVALASGTTALDEIVVIGYGTAAKTTLTGNNHLPPTSVIHWWEGYRAFLPITGAVSPVTTEPL